MSGAVRAGLIFGVVGAIIVIALSFIFPICGPLGAAIAGGLAGYFGIRWSSVNPSVGKGVLASVIAGVIVLIATIVFVIIGFSALRSNPQFAEAMEQALQQQQQTNPEISSADLEVALTAAAPVAGFCLGIINLLAAVIVGAIVGLIANRNPAPTQQPPMAPPPMSPTGS